MNQFLSDYDKSVELLDSCDDRNPPFYEFLKNHKYLFFDTELKSVCKSIKALNDVVRRVEKRFDRVKNYNVSNSSLQAIARDIQYTKYPWLYYDFRFEDIRICLVRIKDFYYVHYDGIEYETVSHWLKYHCLTTLPEDYRFITPVEGNWTSFTSCADVFKEMIVYFLGYDDLFQGSLI